MVNFWEVAIAVQQGKGREGEAEVSLQGPWRKVLESTVTLEGTLVLALRPDPLSSMSF